MILELLKLFFYLLHVHVSIRVLSNECQQMTDTCFVSPYIVFIFFSSVRHKSMYMQILLYFPYNSFKLCIPAYDHICNHILFCLTTFEGVIALFYMFFHWKRLFVSYVQQINGFLWVFQFPLPLKQISSIQLKMLLKVTLNTYDL